MGEERIILRAKTSAVRVCCDHVAEGVLLTRERRHGLEGQVLVPAEDLRSLGEWLIERANQAGEN